MGKVRRRSPRMPQTEHNVLFSFEDFTLDVARRELKRRWRGGRARTAGVRSPGLPDREPRPRGQPRRSHRRGLERAGRFRIDAGEPHQCARQALGDSGEAQRLIRTIQRKGVRFAGEAREAETPPCSRHRAARHRRFAVPDRPSIAVLPFTNLSGDVEQDYFADGVTEEIIIALSRCAGSS
jgi:hypothetical protein